MLWFNLMKFHGLLRKNKRGLLICKADGYKALCSKGLWKINYILNWIISQRFWKVVGQQTCTKKFFVISYWLFWPACVWLFFEKENLALCLLKTKYLMKKLKKFIVKLQCSFLLSATLFLNGSALNFSSPKKLSNKSKSKWKMKYVLQRP